MAKPDWQQYMPDSLVLQTLQWIIGMDINRYRLQLTVRSGIYCSCSGPSIHMSSSPIHKSSNSPPLSTFDSTALLKDFS